MSFLKEIIAEWSDDNASRLAAALAYYTVFSLAPLLVIAVGVASLLFNQEQVQAQLSGQIQAMVGPDAAEAVQEWIGNANRGDSGLIASIVGVVVLLFGASGVFGQLQSAMNYIWDVETIPGRGIWGLIKDRFLSFTMVLGVGFLLLVSLVVSAGLSALQNFMNGLLPGMEILWQVVNFVISLGVITLLFALIFKILPDVEIRWRSVWIGAFVTAVLFNIGKILIGLYLGNATVASTYGAAGSLIVILLWVYYSAQILFLGAEFTQVYARRNGLVLRPGKNAVWMEGEAPETLNRAPDTTEQEGGSGIVPPDRTRRDQPEAYPTAPGSRPVYLPGRPTSAAAPIRQAPEGVYPLIGLTLAAAAAWIFAIFRVMVPGIKSGGQTTTRTPARFSKKSIAQTGKKLTRRISEKLPSQKSVKRAGKKLTERISENLPSQKSIKRTGKKLTERVSENLPGRSKKKSIGRAGKNLTRRIGKEISKRTRKKSIFDKIREALFD